MKNAHNIETIHIPNALHHPPEFLTYIPYSMTGLFAFTQNFTGNSEVSSCFNGAESSYVGVKIRGQSFESKIRVILTTSFNMLSRDAFVLELFKIALGVAIINNWADDGLIGSPSLMEKK